jgi:hypothetical protein
MPLLSSKLYMIGLVFGKRDGWLHSIKRTSEKGERRKEME